MEQNYFSNNNETIDNSLLDYSCKQLLDVVPVPIAIYDMNGLIVYINHSFESVFGWSLEESYGKRIEFIAKGAKQETSTGLKRMLSGEKVELNTRRLTKNGNVLDIQLIATLLHSKDGKTNGSIVVYRDMTEEITAKEKLVATNTDLAEKTAELYANINKISLINTTLAEQNLATIKGYVSLIELRHQDLGAHCRRVANLVKPICAILKIKDQSEVQQIILAGLLHDIGKVGLPDVTLSKDYSKLTSRELDEVKKHPVIGQGQVQVLSTLTSASLIIRYHHENYNGSGYPDGLIGDSIPIGARIIRVLDSYDRAAYNYSRWKKPLPKSVLDGLYKERGKKYDYDVLNALFEVIGIHEESYEKIGEHEISIFDLTAGMVLSRDVRTTTGLLVLPSDEALTQNHIDKLLNYRKLYKINDSAYIYS